MSLYGQDMQTQIERALEHLDQELSGIRTGRANPALIEDMPVECYGATSSLQQLASISAPEPRMLLVQPWDPTVTKDIAKAISQSSLGINPVVDGKNIRLPFPPMTTERRTELIKVVENKGEEAKISIRNGREQIMKKIKNEERDHDISEDEAAVASKDVQVAIEESHQAITERIAKKTEEISTI